jgi:hypothetical protein
VPRPRGVVYLEPAPLLAAAAPPIVGHWDHDGGYEEGPGWDTAEPAFLWGRRRAPVVYLRVDTVTYSYRYYAAGDVTLRLKAPPKRSEVFWLGGEKVGNWSGVDSRRWPRAPKGREADIVDNYGGTVHLVREARLEYDQGFRARWYELDRDGVHRFREQDVDDVANELVPWGRKRAQYVLLELSGAEYFSAGDEDLPGLDIPRWPDFPLTASMPPPPPGAEISIRVETSPLSGKTFPLDETLLW